MLHTRSCMLPSRQQRQIVELFSSEEYVVLEVTWSAYQNITWRLPCARYERGHGHDVSRNQHADFRARTEGPDRAHHATQDTQTPIQGHPGLLRPPPHQQWPHRSHQRTPRTPTQIRTRIQKPLPLHLPCTPRNRRIQTRTTPSIMKSRITPTISHNRYLTVTDGHPRFTKRQQHQPKPSVESCFSRRPRRGYAWFRREPDRLLLCSRCVRSRGGARASG